MSNVSMEVDTEICYYLKVGLASDGVQCAADGLGDHVQGDAYG